MKAEDEGAWQAAKKAALRDTRRGDISKKKPFEPYRVFSTVEHAPSLEGKSEMLTGAAMSRLRETHRDTAPGDVALVEAIMSHSKPLCAAGDSTRKATAGPSSTE